MDATTGAPKVPSQDERGLLALRELILSAFQSKFGPSTIIGVSIKPSLLFGSIATVMVRENLPDMDRFAEQMERDITEGLERPLAIFIKQPIRYRIAGLLKGREYSSIA